MPFCSLDDSAALFDSTPVENMWITEYMLHAPGDYVKVYLYGLMLCYHDAQRMSLSSMARDLDMTEEEVVRAFKYWSRDGLVHQTGDNPISFCFCNLKQLTLTRTVNPAEQLYDRSFTDEIRRTLEGYTLSDRDYQTIFDWVDQLELPEEVVLMLLQQEVKRMKKHGIEHFSSRVADKMAQEWARSGVRTVEDVERLVIVDKERELELRRLLARLGQRRNPSEDEKAMYNKWRDEWGFEADAIQAACQETTKGIPTMAYLDGILQRQHQLGRHEAQALSTGLKHDDDERDFVRDIYAELGRTGISPTSEDLGAITRWREEGYSDDMILLAASEAHKRNGNMEDVQNTLDRWHKLGLTTVQQVKAERTRAQLLNEQLQEVYAQAGLNKPVSAADRSTMNKWLGEWSMSFDLVLLAAQYARGSASPIAVADKILADWHRAGIATQADASAEHERHKQFRASGSEPAANAGSLLRHSPEDRKATYSAAVVDLDQEDDE